jgi:predicted TIM-barrel fold metal-dependent hydrolase
MHFFGPYARYPLSSGRSYTPPEASLAAYRAMAATIGIERTVIVQPSVYGTDNAVTLDAVDALGRDRTRAVVVIDEGFDFPALRAMAARGACGMRINAVSGSNALLVRLEALGARLAELGWHLQVYAHPAELLALEPVLARLPCPLVLDHMGGVKADRQGVENPAFQALLRLLRGGAWAKLCGYRSSIAGAPYADVAAMARAMLAAAPGRCVWGTDWPHPSLASPEEVPDDGVLMDALGDWAPEAAQRQAILVDNPARLYGF